MNKELTKKTTSVEIEKVLMMGDLSGLNSDQRLQYYKAVCESLGLNALTKPFQFLTLKGKLVMYALKGCTDQLRSIRGVSISEPKVQPLDDIVFVSVTATDKSGRTDADVGAVAIGSLVGDDKCNAIMKAITKAKRRVTLSICGLGMLDESEIETIPNASIVPMEPQGLPYPEPKTVDMPKLTENKVQEGQVYDFWYSFETLKSGNLKGFQAACAMAKKQEACRIEDQDTGTIAYCCMKPLEPRSKFDKFLWTKKGPAEKISEVVDETKEK